MSDWLRDLGTILRETGKELFEDQIPGRGAALSYYVLLSLGPLLVIVIGALEFFLSREQARASVVRALRDNVGARAGETVATVLERVEPPSLLAPESILTVVLLLFGATAAFANIRGSLNAIWDVEPEDQSVREAVLGWLMTRVRGFVMVVVTGLVLVVSFIISSVAVPMSDLFGQRLPRSELLVRLLDGSVSLLLTGLLFGGIYRTLPAVKVRWRTIWVGAFATAFIFVLGKALAAWLISSASWTSYYGPGASVVAFVAWVYLSSQLFYVGAEFTQVWSRVKGGVMAEKRL